MKVKDCMEKNVCYLAPENTALDCAQMMNEKHIGAIPICDQNKKIVGIVTDRDIVLRVVANKKDAMLTSISEIMTKDVCYCFEDDEVINVENKMAKEQIRRIPVVDSNENIVGIMTFKNLCDNENLNNLSIGQTLDNICTCNRKNAQ